MKELNKKVFITIFSLLSVFLFIAVFVVNLTNYIREYNNVYRSLNVLNEKNNAHRPLDLPNMIIMDYEIYTVEVNNLEIQSIYSHGSSSNMNIEEIAEKIISNNKNSKLYIGNLFFSKYSYRYEYDNTITIVNNASVNQKLLILFIESILFYIIVDVLLYFVSLKITSWIIKPAEEAFQKQKDFIADASHELKTPLAVIMASSDELKSDKKNSKYVENIKYESDRMSHLITSMLDLSKIESGVNKDNYKLENLSKIVEKIALTFEGIAFEESVKIISSIESDISFKCSREEIEKVCSILLDNAIKHSYKDSVIHVNLMKDKNMIKLEVINKGDPIKEENYEKIFERFYRIDKARNRKENRYGLGLAIAKNIVLNHNGAISVCSNNGTTTFTVIFKK